jgi:hypothetical protein
MSKQSYLLDIDGPEFRRQRQWLGKQFDDAYSFKRDDLEIIEGLTNLLDAIADEANDRYNIDCLLTDN